MVKRQYPNEDLPSTAISFKRETLDLLKKIAAREDRSLAAQVRTICEDWLQSPEGVAAIRKSASTFDIRKIEQSALDKT